MSQLCLLYITLSKASQWLILYTLMGRIFQERPEWPKPEAQKVNSWEWQRVTSPPTGKSGVL